MLKIMVRKFFVIMNWKKVPYTYNYLRFLNFQKLNLAKNISLSLFAQVPHLIYLSFTHVSLHVTIRFFFRYIDNIFASIMRINSLTNFHHLYVPSYG